MIALKLIADAQSVVQSTSRRKPTWKLQSEGHSGEHSSGAMSRRIFFLDKFGDFYKYTTHALVFQFKFISSTDV